MFLLRFAFCRRRRRRRRCRRSCPTSLLCVRSVGASRCRRIEYYMNWARACSELLSPGKFDLPETGSAGQAAGILCVCLCVCRIRGPVRKIVEWIFCRYRRWGGWPPPHSKRNENDLLQSMGGWWSVGRLCVPSDANGSCCRVFFPFITFCVPHFLIALVRTSSFRNTPYNTHNNCNQRARANATINGTHAGWVV